MKPRAFAYFAPHTLDEALTLLAEHGSDARPLAGGQSLVQRMNMREDSPAVLIDLNQIDALGSLHRVLDGALAIGAMTRQQRLIDEEEVRVANPALSATAATVAFRAVRIRGTLGGSVANAEPGAQLPLLLTVLDARAALARRGQRRTVPIANLITGPRATTLAPDELLVEVRVPAISRHTGYAIAEFRRGHSGPPLVVVVALLELGANGAIATARVGVSGACPTPLRLHGIEARLVGQAATRAVFAASVANLTWDATEGDPVLADAALRRRATRALLTRALLESAARATERGRRQEGQA